MAFSHALCVVSLGTGAVREKKALRIGESARGSASVPEMVVQNL